MKRLKAVDIKPEGAVVEITGKNEAGKSSVLDSILYAFSGRDIESKPIRDGEEKAKIEVDCGDFIVKRTITEKGKTLRIETKEGDQKKSPQSFLNDVVGKISFDPMDFIRQDNRKQREIMMGLVPQADKILRSREVIRIKRGNLLEMKKRGNDTNKKFQAMPYHDDAPEEEPDATRLFRDLEEWNEKKSIHERDMENKRQAEKEIRSLKAKKRELLEELSNVESDIQDREDSLREIESALEAVDDPDESVKETLTMQIRTIEQDRKKFQENTEREAVRKDLQKMHEKYKAMQKDLDAMLQAHKKLESTAAFPVKGLQFTDDGLLFNDIPLDQLSQAQKIKVGMAVSMAMNPKMRVILCREASLLDEENLQVIREIAEKKDYQIWMERVDSTGKTGIVIEEGEVKHG